MRASLGLILSIIIFVAVAIFGVLNIRTVRTVQDNLEEIHTSQNALSTINLLINESTMYTLLYLETGNYEHGERGLHNLRQAASMVTQALHYDYSIFGSAAAGEFIGQIDELRKAISELTPLREAMNRNEIDAYTQRLWQEFESLSDTVMRGTDTNMKKRVAGIWSIIAYLALAEEGLSSGPMRQEVDIYAEQMLRVFAEALELLEPRLEGTAQITRHAALKKDLQILANEAERLIRLRKELYAASYEIFERANALQPRIEAYRNTYHDLQLQLSFSRSELEQPFLMAASLGGLLLFLVTCLTVRSTRREARRNMDLLQSAAEVDWSEKPRLKPDQINGVTAKSRRRP